MGAWDSFKNWLVGGDATDAINPNLAHGGILGSYGQQQMMGAQQRAAPMMQAQQLGQAAQVNTGANAGLDGMMGGMFNRLQGVASGQQQGAGELAAQRQMGQSIAAQQAAARMAHGANAALAMRSAARNMADMGVAGAGQAQQAALQDQSNANGQLGQFGLGMRGQNNDVAGQNAQFQQQQMLQQGQFGQQANMANQAAQLQQRGMNDQYSLQNMAQLLGLDQSQLQAMLAKQQLGMQDQGHLGSLLQIGGSIGAAAAAGGGGGAAAGGAAAASDRTLKTEIKDARKDADELISVLKPYSYKYKDGAKYGEGSRMGIMAQDLAKSKAGAAIVGTLNDGSGKLGYDVAKSTSAMLGALGRLGERVRELEGKR